MSSAASLSCSCGKPAIEGHGRCVRCQLRVHADRGATSMAYAVGLASGLCEKEVDEILYESSNFALWACGVRQRAVVGRIA